MEIAKVHALEKERDALNTEMLKPDLRYEERVAIRQQIAAIDNKISSIKVPDTRGFITRSFAPIRDNPIFVGGPFAFSTIYGAMWFYMIHRHEVSPYTEDQLIRRKRYFRIDCRHPKIPPALIATGVWTAFIMVTTGVLKQATGNRY
jgi:hypothetical protein